MSNYLATDLRGFHTRISSCAVQDEVGDLLKHIGWTVDLSEGVAGVVMGLNGGKTRFFKAV